MSTNLYGYDGRKPQNRRHLEYQDEEVNRYFSIRDYRRTRGRRNLLAFEDKDPYDENLYGNEYDADVE